MSNNFPTIGDYNQTILHNGGRSLDSLSDMEFIPSRTVPIRVFLFGSGAFAAVFKGRLKNCLYAIRCFLSSENEAIERYEFICNYLKYLNSNWVTPCELIQDEISVNHKWYPVLKMDWIEGSSLHKFVSNNITRKTTLALLQHKLVELSNDLESNYIGHGDLQSGNIIIVGNADNFVIKLIDYDGMYVDGIPFVKAIEKGRSEYQHPKRTLNDYDYKIDRFSIWVMITAIEALKYDNSLWGSIVHGGGFNTDDNFLFTVNDFLNPNQSKLFNRLLHLNKPSLNFYLTNLKRFCSNDISSVTSPALYDPSDDGEDEEIDFDGSGALNDLDVPYGKVRIISNVGSAAVLSTTFQRIGTTPIDLDKNIYNGKTIIVSNGRETKQINVSQNENIIEVNFA